MSGHVLLTCALLKKLHRLNGNYKYKPFYVYILKWLLKGMSCIFMFQKLAQEREKLQRSDSASSKCAYNVEWIIYLSSAHIHSVINCLCVRTTSRRSHVVLLLCQTEKSSLKLLRLQFCFIMIC